MFSFQCLKNATPVVLGFFLALGMVGCSNDSNKNTAAPPRENPAITLTPSVAQQWNEVVIQAIRNDFARPTVHARNLFHTSAAMFDAWSAYSTSASAYLLGRQYGTLNCAVDKALFINTTKQINADAVERERQTAISYATFRLIQHRFKSSPRSQNTLVIAEQLMKSLGFDSLNTSTDVSTGSAVALGNLIAQCYIEFGLQDGSNEGNNYASPNYKTVNPPLAPQLAGNPNIVDFNRWQPLALQTFIDQAGNPITGGALAFLSPEWGKVEPFALNNAHLSIHERNGVQYKVYFDPGPPPMLGGVRSEEYKWNFSLVSQWSSHLDPADKVMWDISPASLGNIKELPETFEEYKNFYSLDGGDGSAGYKLNPATGLPYEKQIVPRGDYTRALAEFWADGLESETPPGHWFVILNEVNKHPKLKRQFRGQGAELNALEWDVKAYFALGGAMHDAAITAWSIKGWYDYVRPVSAIRAMADLGQSSDRNLPSWHPNGIPLSPGFIELVPPGDPLAGYKDQFAGKIKVRAWQGPEYVVNPKTDTGDVGWILAENWWPYQRPSFVTPPFAGFISGHSTFSRAAAEVLTLLTGDEYFPGGKSSFKLKTNEHLKFEQGPSVDITLEWATYRDASNQCSLSRIWGGIHPPVDDIPGRKIGISIGVEAFERAEHYFLGKR
ncbi:MAG: hypothetical protein RL497_1512 [Pseudomonadota bacterium]|jgi:hypothetical protein